MTMKHEVHDAAGEIMRKIMPKMTDEQMLIGLGRMEEYTNRRKTDITRNALLAVTNNAAIELVQMNLTRLSDEAIRTRMKRIARDLIRAGGKPPRREAMNGYQPAEVVLDRTDPPKQGSGVPK